LLYPNLMFGFILVKI